MLERSNPEPGRWIPPGQAAAVGVHAIPGGCVYLGRRLRSPVGVEPSLIDPDLPVAAPGEPSEAAHVGPRPAYHLLSPQARGQYLDWLATDRRADVAPGLVLLFCTGLERRLLLDADADPAVRAELPAITAEVHRLRARYGETGSTLRRTLDGLLALLELLAARGATPVPGPAPAGPVDAGAGAGLPAGMGPMGVRVALARFAAAAAPVPVDWARVWVRHHPTLRPRGVQRQCPAEFDRLFTLRYRQRHGAGLVPPGDVPGIRLRYQPAHPGLPTTLACREDLPDILTEPRCTRALGNLVDGAATALEPYRQWLSRFPAGRGSLAAATLLPRELVDVGHGQVGALRVWAERQLDGRAWAVVDAGGFWQFWSTAAPDRMARDEAAALLDALALLDLGVEPDVRFGAPALTRRPAVLFRPGRPASDGPSARFPAAAVIMRCAAAVASATSVPRSIDPYDARGTAVLATAGNLAAALRLGSGEDLRLTARLGWLLTTRVDIDRLGRHTATLATAERDIAGRYLVTVVQAADPAIGPAAVAALIRAYRILGLEPDLVFQRLHERSLGLGVGAVPVPPHPPPAGRPAAPGPDEPVVVQVADATPNGYALPWAPEPTPSGGMRLDPTTISRKLAESDTAATLLQSIFDAGNDEDGMGIGDAARGIADGGAGRIAGGGAGRIAGGGAGRIATLDPAHSALLRALANRTSWSRAEYAELAAAHGLLPDGALDMLNDVSIEAAGAPVVADGDTIAVDDDVLVELFT